MVQQMFPVSMHRWQQTGHECSAVLATRLAAVLCFHAQQEQPGCESRSLRPPCLVAPSAQTVSWAGAKCLTLKHSMQQQVAH